MSSVARCYLDHLVIVAPSLVAGAKYVRNALGVTPQAGGEHERMGTHNLLLRLSDTTYLEVLAANPEAPAPKRPRWFGLDRLESNATPRLATWVVRTSDIRGVVAASPVPWGRIEAMSRGSLNWLMTIAEDGSLPFDGVAPMLMQWQNDPHPAGLLDDLGCSLVRLEGFHPEAVRIAGMLESMGFDGAFSVSATMPHERPHLVAHIQTPGGTRRLGPSK